jgi:hypothetical protein
MKKFSIAALSIICCTQYIQSMELDIPSSDDCGYQIITKSLKDRPQSPISKEFNALSEELYKENITETEIKDLVHKGANLNYESQEFLHPVAVYFAFNETEQGIKNMKTILELGAKVRHLKNKDHVPLDIAVMKNSTDMIELLMPYETPVVTLYEDKCYRKDGSVNGIRYDYSEKELREYIICQLFRKENIRGIELLLTLKLMTPNRGLKEFYTNMKPNQDIFNLLITHGADNTSNIVAQIILNKMTALRINIEKTLYDLNQNRQNFNNLGSMLSFASKNS